MIRSISSLRKKIKTQKDNKSIELKYNFLRNEFYLFRFLYCYLLIIRKHLLSQLKKNIEKEILL